MSELSQLLLVNALDAVEKALAPKPVGGGFGIRREVMACCLDERCEECDGSYEDDRIGLIECICECGHPGRGE